LRDVSEEPSLTVGLLPRATGPHWLATFFTDEFGRARVVARYQARQIIGSPGKKHKPGTVSLVECFGTCKRA